jgi:hypothetical protein
MKELSLEEVVRIAGGVPPTSTLDELTYRAQEPAPARDGQRLVESAVRSPLAD